MQLKGYIFVILSAMCSSLLPIFIKLGYRLHISLEMLLALRFYTSAAVLIFICILFQRIKFSTLKPWIPPLVLQGIFYFSGAYCYTSAAKYLPAAVTSILFYVYPAIVLLIMSVFFKEKMSTKRIISLILTLSGCIMVIDIFHQSFAINWLGIAFGLGSAVSFAIYNIRGYSLTKEINPIIVSTFVLISCSLTAMFTIAPVSLLETNLTLFQWLVGLGTALICTVMAVICYLKGLSILGASRASIISTIELAFTIVLASLILGEKLSFLQLIGGLCIVLGIVILQLEKKPDGNSVKQTI